MGLLDKIIKEGKELIDNVATEENKEKALEFLNTVKEGLQDVAKDVKENVSDFADDVKNTVGDLSDGVKNRLDEIKTSDEEEATFYEYDESDNRTAREKILKVLNEKFPEVRQLLLIVNIVGVEILRKKKELLSLISLITIQIEKNTLNKD